MLAAAIPVKMPVPFASGAGGGFIRQVPIPSQVGIQNGAASFTDGYPPLTFLQTAGGGVPPFGQDTNGLLNAVTAWLRWEQAGGAIPWDSTFSAAMGGYPLGAVVASATTFALMYVNSVDGNVTNPDAAGAGWTPFSFLGGATTGDVKITLKTVADPGWLLITADPFTIGNAGSGATYANANALNLYTLLWSNVSNSFAPVTGGRGANPAGDFAAGKPIAFIRVLGRALAIGGAGSGLTSRALGQTFGEETHLMTLAELVAHNHTIVDPGHLHTIPFSGGNQTQAGADSAKAQAGTTNTSTATTGITINNNGGGTPFNVMQPTSFFNLEVCL